LAEYFFFGRIFTILCSPFCFDFFSLKLSFCFAWSCSFFASVLLFMVVQKMPFAFHFNKSYRQFRS